MSDAVDIVAACGGEVITYLPQGGTARTFRALVERRPTQVESAGGFQYGAKTLELCIPKDAVNGVLAVQARKDRVRFKKNLGDAQESDFSVNTILQEDEGLAGSGGMFRVLVQM